MHRSQVKLSSPFRTIDVKNVPEKNFKMLKNEKRRKIL